MKNKINEFYISMICLVFLLWNYSMDRENTFIIKKIIEKINVSPKEKEKLERQFHDNVIFNTKIQKELQNEMIFHSIEFVDRQGQYKDNTNYQDDQYKKRDGGSNNTDNDVDEFDVDEYERMKYVMDYINTRIEKENVEIDSEIESLKLKLDKENKKWFFRDEKHIKKLEEMIEVLERKKKGSLST